MSPPLPEQSGPVEELVRLLHEQSIAHAIIFIDPQGLICGWQGGAQRLFGYRAEEILGQPSARLFTPEDIARGIPELELEIAANDAGAEDDRWQVRKDGSRVWVNGAVSALRDKEGKVIGFGKILRNRTDQRAHVESLEHRVESLAKAEHRKNIFLSTLAHELRNPLAPLVNALELIRLTVPSTPDLDYPLKLIGRQVEFIRRMVDDLLDITRIGVGKIQLETQRIDLCEALEIAAESCRPSVEERHQQLFVLLPRGPIHIDADPGRLQQVFVNLLNNANKYTPEQGRIWLKLTVEEDEAVVRVQDTGIGISADMLPRIFDLFTQEEVAYRSGQGGLGIGLALVKDLVSLHRGTVQVRSDGRGQGSEFTVRLPLQEPTSSESGTSQPQQEP